VEWLVPWYSVADDPAERQGADAPLREMAYVLHLVGNVKSHQFDND
jgi:hypothetical protein